MKKLSLIGLLKTTLYIFIGIFIIIGNTFMHDVIHTYINYLVGIPMLIGVLISVVNDFKYKRYLHDENHMASHFIALIISILILLAHFIFKDHDIAIVCILWGVVTIMNSSLRLNLCIHEAIKKESFIYEAIEGIVEIVLSFLLIYDPEEHINLHIYVLGIEYILEALMTLILNVKNNVLISNKDNEI